MKNLREKLIEKGYEAEEACSSNKLWFFTKGNVRVSLDDETIYIKIMASIGYKKVLNRMYNSFELQTALQDLENVVIN